MYLFWRYFFTLFSAFAFSEALQHLATLSNILIETAGGTYSMACRGAKQLHPLRQLHRLLPLLRRLLPLLRLRPLVHPAVSDSSPSPLSGPGGVSR